MSIAHLFAQRFSSLALHLGMNSCAPGDCIGLLERQCLAARQPSLHSPTNWTELQVLTCPQVNDILCLQAFSFTVPKESVTGDG